MVETASSSPYRLGRGQFGDLVAWPLVLPAEKPPPNVDTSMAQYLHVCSCSRAQSRLSRERRGKRMHFFLVPCPGELLRELCHASQSNASPEHDLCQSQWQLTLSERGPPPRHAVSTCPHGRCLDPLFLPHRTPPWCFSSPTLASIGPLLLARGP